MGMAGVPQSCRTVAPHPGESVTGNPPRPGAQGSEPGIERRSHRTEWKSTTGGDVLGIWATGDDDLVAIGSEGLGQR
jgi:hypothetical protein